MEWLFVGLFDVKKNEIMQISCFDASARFQLESRSPDKSVPFNIYMLIVTHN